MLWHERILGCAGGQVGYREWSEPLACINDLQLDEEYVQQNMHTEEYHLERRM